MRLAAAFAVAVSAGVVLTAAPAGAEQVGTDDMKLTNGTDPRDVQVAYNPTGDTHLLVWDEGVSPAPELIRGQVVNATGGVVAGPFTIGQTALAGGFVGEPAVTWDSVGNRWWVAFSADDTVTGEREIFVNTVSAAGAAGTQFRVSDMGDDTISFDAQQPDITFNATANEAFVVWRGDDPTPADGEDEIWGQRLSAALGEVGTNDFRISTLGTDGNVLIDARGPQVAWHAPSNQYAVVYEEQSSLLPVAVWVQVVASNGAAAPAQQVVAAPVNDEALRATVAADDTGSGWLIAWEAFTPATTSGAIAGRTLSSAGSLGAPLALSTAGVDSQAPDLTYNTVVDRYGLVFHADALAGAGTEYEIYGSLLTPTGSVAEPLERLSTMGTDGVASNVTINAAAAPGAGGRVLAVWQSDDTAAGDTEVYGQYFQVNVPPTVTINQAVGQADPTNASSVNFTAVFSEAVLGFASSDIVTTGSTATIGTITVTGTGPSYNVNIAVTGNGTVVASIPAAAVVDSAGLSSSASTSTDNVVTLDTVAPTVTINQALGQTDPTNGSPILFTAVFSEPVTGFTGADVAFTGSTAGGTLSATVTGTGPSYTVSVSGMTGTGTVVASIAAGAASDTAGNNSAGSTSTDNSVTYDATAPTVTINQAAGQLDPTSGSPVEFTTVFSEPVTGFTAADVAFTGSTASGTLAATVTGTGPTYTVSVTGMTGTGTVVASIVAGAASDTAGNPSAASTSTDNSVTYDITQPGVTVTAVSPDPTNSSPVAFTVTFTEPVTGFVAADVDFTGSTAGGTLTAVVGGGPTSYTVSVLGMTSSGEVSVSVPAAAAIDAAGNDNTASNTASVTWDNVAPTVTIDEAVGQDDPTATLPIVFTAVFSEPIPSFPVSAVSFTGSTAPGTYSVTISGEGTDTITISVSGITGSGTVVASIPGGAVTDAAGNGNAASTSTDNSVTSVVPSFTLEPASLDFGEVPLTASKVLDVLVRNTTGSPITVSMAGGGLSTSSGAFGNSQSCQGATLAANATCTITYEFEPDALGVASVTNSFSLNGESYQVELTGTGVTGLAATPTTVDFGDQSVGTTSAPRDVTITNTSAFTLTDIQIAGGGISTSTGDFGNTQNCQGATLAPSGTCVVSYVFAPEALGPSTLTNTFSIGPNGSASPLQVSIDLLGNGVPAFTVTPTIDFGDVPVGATSGPLVATVTNVSGTTITDIQIAGGGLSSPPGDFANTQSCQGATLADGETCQLNYTFSPQSLGAKAITNSFSLNGQPFEVDLTGTGVNGLTPSTTSLDFGDVMVGSTSASQQVVFTNTSSLPIGPIQMAGGGLGGPTDDYSNVQNCQGVTLAPTESCAVTYEFHPRTVGTKALTNSFTLNTVPFAIDLTGVGLSPVTVAPASLDFGSRLGGTTSAPQTITVTNVSATSLTALATGATLGDAANYSLTDNCSGATLAAAASCTVLVTFRPTAAGALPSTVTLTLFGQEFVVALTGTGTNDAPILTAPATLTAELGVDVELNGTDEVSVSDGFGTVLVVTLTTTDGELTVPTTGVTVTGNGTASVSVTGTAATVDAALAALTVVYSEVGDHTIEITAADQSFSTVLTDSATIAVTVVDTTPPVITVPGAAVIANTEPGKAGARVTFTVTVADRGNAPGSNPGVPQAFRGAFVEAVEPDLTCSPSSGSFFPIGSTTVTCTATDAAGNTSTESFVVQVVDAEKPVITSPGNQRISLGNGRTRGPLSYILPTARDNSGTANVSCTPARGATVSTGNVTVTCTATDPSFNAASTSFVVNVVSGVVPRTGGGGTLAPIAAAVTLGGLALFGATRRRRSV